MKKLLILAFISITGIYYVNAQQLPLYSQYMMNGFLLNPAMAGSVDYTPIRLTARTQWTGIEDAPKTFALSGHTLFNNKKVGVGGYIYSDMFGPIMRTGIQGSFAYHLSLDGMNSKLAFGLSMQGYQFRLDESKLSLIETSDPAITYGVESRFLPDATFGAHLYNTQYFVGISATQLFQFKVNLGEDNTDQNKMVRHYYATAGYKFNAGENMEIEPSFMLKATEVSPLQVDINLKAIYQKNYWLGVSYRTQDAIIAMLGIKVDKYYIGYAFDYTMSNIMDYSNGSHEILIGFNLGEGATKGSRLL
jgi:type IX secretion system PorP/SprF family membrane protein